MLLLLLLLLLYQFSYYKLKEINSVEKNKPVSYITTNKYNKFNTTK